MQVQIGVVIAITSLLCTVLGLLIGIFTFKRNRDKDVKSDASKSAVIETKLDNIYQGVDQIRIDFKANEKRTNELEKTVVRLEESTKSAHKRIDALEQKGEV